MKNSKKVLRVILILILVPAVLLYLLVLGDPISRVRVYCKAAAHRQHYYADTDYRISLICRNFKEAGYVATLRSADLDDRIYLIYDTDFLLVERTAPDYASTLPQAY